MTGNSSPTGSAALNDQLSQLRAEYVKGRLETDAPALQGHVIATGVGAKNNLVGTGRRRSVRCAGPQGRVQGDPELLSEMGQARMDQQSTTISRRVDVLPRESIELRTIAFHSA